MANRHIYERCLKMFDERVQDSPLKDQLKCRLEQLYNDRSHPYYLRNLQFMYENWDNTIPKKHVELKPRAPIQFYNPKPGYLEGRMDPPPLPPEVPEKPRRGRPRKWVATP